MKKFKVLFMVMLVSSVLLLVGCGNNEEGNTNATVEGGETEVTTPENTFDFAAGLEDNGFFADVTATDLVDVTNTKAITVPSEIHMITDEAVDGTINNILLEYQTSNQITDRAVEDGETVNIDYVGSIDGVEFEGGSTNGAGTDVTIGVTQYIDDFLAQLVGHTPGETIDVEVTFPDDYQAEDLQGKDAVFVTTINYINETITPELTDEFVTEMLLPEYGVSTVEELKMFTKTELKETSVRTYIQNYLLSDVAVTEIPEAIVTYQENLMVNYYESAAVSYGMGIDEFLQSFVGVESLDALLEAANPEIVSASQVSLVVQAIAEDADLEVTEAYIGEYFIEVSGSEDYSEAEAAYGLSYIKYSILQEVVLDHLVEAAVLAE